MSSRRKPENFMKEINNEKDWQCLFESQVCFIEIKDRAELNNPLFSFYIFSICVNNSVK